MALVCRCNQFRLQAGVIKRIAEETGAVVVLNVELDRAALHCHECNQQIANPDSLPGHQVNVVELHGRQTPVSKG